MMVRSSKTFLFVVALLLENSSNRHATAVTAATVNANDNDPTATLSHSTTKFSLRRLRQKMVYIPDLFDVTPMQHQSLSSSSSSSEWYDSNRGVVFHDEKSRKELPSLFNKYRSRHLLSTLHTNTKKYSDENLLLEMEIFERLLQDEGSMSFSMPTQPTAPTPIIVTPPTAPSPVVAPTIISPPTAPTPASIPTTPSVPTPQGLTPTPGVITPSGVLPPQVVSPVVAPSTKGKDPNGMMSSNKGSAPSTSKGVAPSTPSSKTPSSKGGAESPSSKGGPKSKGQPSSPSSKTMNGAPSTLPSSKEEPVSKGMVGTSPSTPSSKVPSSKVGVESPSSKGGPSSKGQPSSKKMNDTPSKTPSSKGEPESKGQPSSPTSKGMAGAPSTADTDSPTPLLGSKGGPSTSAPFGAMNMTPTPSPVASIAPDETPTAPNTTPIGPDVTPTAQGPVPTTVSPSFIGEDALAPDGSETSRGAMIFSKCGVSESDRSQAVLGDVSTISPLSELVDDSSFAHAALLWLDQEDDLIVCSDGTGAVVQRYVLAMLYFSMNGFEWTNCRATTSEVAGPCIDGKPWLDASNECEWYGIECDANSTVTKLTLKANNLVGVLPDELFFLTGLVGLSLDHNMYIGGEIPEAIGKLTKLMYIELDENFLGGSIPESLYSLSTLQAIDLNGNKLMGTISESIMNLSSLAVLQIEDNLFEGALPTGLASLKELLVLYVHGNNFTGTSLQHVCAMIDSRRQTNVAYLQFLTADCKDTGKVECTCCDCF